MTYSLITSDLHFTSRQRDEYRWELFAWLAAQTSGRQVSDIFILGDLTDAKDNHPAELVLRIIDELTSLVLLTKAKLHVLKGNHDYTDPDGPFFSFLDRLPGITYYTKPTAVVVGGMHVLFVPHVASWKPRAAWRVEHSLENHDLILAHQTFGGAKASTGMELEGVPLATVSKKNTHDTPVISGDIHVPQKLGNVEYCGSPYPIHFGDEFEPRVLLLDNDTRKTKSLSRDCIAKRTLRVTSAKQVAKTAIFPGDQVKVLMTLPRSEFGSWADVKQAVAASIIERGGIVHDVQLFEAPTVAKREHLSDRAGSERVSGAQGGASVYQVFVKETGVEKAVAKAGRKYLKAVTK